MHHDEHDDLWQLLGRARTPRVSPFFSRNVLRAIREEQPAAPWWTWLRLRWRAVSGTAVTAVLAVAFTLAMQTHRTQLANEAIDEAAGEVAGSPDFQVIDNLDTLLAWDDNDVWLDNSAR